MPLSLRLAALLLLASSAGAFELPSDMEARARERANTTCGGRTKCEQEYLKLMLGYIPGVPAAETMKPADQRQAPSSGEPSFRSPTGESTSTNDDVKRGPESRIFQNEEAARRQAAVEQRQQRAVKAEGLAQKMATALKQAAPTELGDTGAAGRAAASRPGERAQAPQDAPEQPSRGADAAAVAAAAMASSPRKGLVTHAVPAALHASAPVQARPQSAAATRPSPSLSPLPPRGFDAPDSPLAAAAVRKRDAGDLQGAALDLVAAVDEEPRNPLTWTIRAEVENALGDAQAARASASRALDLKSDPPLTARALRARAYASLKAGLLQEALADARRAVEMEPDNGTGRLYLAMALDQAGLLAEAGQQLEAALRLDPSLAAAAAPLLEKHAKRKAAPSKEARRFLKVGVAALSGTLLALGLLTGIAGRGTLRRWTSRRQPEPAPPIEDLQVGQALDGIVVVRTLGRGGMGVVHEGLDRKLQRRVALKRMAWSGEAAEEDRERFLREARLVAQLKHPNIAEIYTVLGERDPILVFEFIDGKPLDRLLAESRRFAPERVRRVVAETCSALACAHARGIIHRDLKPSNLMLTGEGGVKVMDFGIAHQARAATLATATAASGTPPYMSPEQALGSSSKASDLYSLGVMSYELLTGRLPFEGPDFMGQKLERRFSPATRHDPGLPAALDAFFTQAFDPDPTKRPKDAPSFALAFERACWKTVQS